MNRNRNFLAFWFLFIDWDCGFHIVSSDTFCLQVDKGISSEVVRSVLAERANLPCLAARTASKVSCFIYLCWSCSEAVWQYVNSLRSCLFFINCRWKPCQKASFCQRFLKHILVLRELSEERMWTLILRYSFSLLIFLSFKVVCKEPKVSTWWT